MNGDYWFPDEITYLTENYSKLPVADIAKHLERTERAVVNKANRMHLRGKFRVKRKNNRPAHNPRYVSDKKALPFEQWHKAQIFLTAIARMKSEHGHISIDLKRLRGAMSSIEKVMAI